MNISDEIQHVLDVSRFAVMATQHQGQPHASLMAFAPMDGHRYLIVATYRATLKYTSLSKDGRVALLIDNRNATDSAAHRGLVITAHGNASEVPADDRAAVMRTYLARHPDFGTFLASADCALLRVAVKAYEVVGSTDDVLWYDLEY